jgi:hypothetical protein
MLPVPFAAAFRAQPVRGLWLMGDEDVGKMAREKLEAANQLGGADKVRLADGSV